MHYSVLVVLPPTDDIKGAIEAAMAPFDEDLDVEPSPCDCRYEWGSGDPRWERNRTAAYTKPPKPDCEECKGAGVDSHCWNPRGGYDYWRIGARWNGYWLLHEDADVSKVIFGEKGYEAVEPHHNVSGARMGDIDFEGMLRKERQEAEAIWARAEAGELSSPMDRYKYGIEKDDTRESYVRNFCQQATYALVMDGKWQERGNDGLDATPEEREERKRAWQSHWWRIANDIPKDHILVVLDCHR